MDWTVGEDYVIQVPAPRESTSKRKADDDATSTIEEGNPR